MKHIKKYNDYFLFENNRIPIKTQYQIFHLTKEERNEYFTKRLEDYKNGLSTFNGYEFEICPKKIKDEYIDTCIKNGYGIYKENYDDIMNPIKKDKYIISSKVFNHEKVHDIDFNKFTDELKSFYIGKLIQHNITNEYILCLSEYQYETCSDDIIKNFFPGIFNLEGDKELQIKNKDVLPKEYKIILIQNLYNTTNKLFISVLIEDLDDSNLCIKDRNSRIIKLNKNEITFSFKSTYEVDQFRQTLELWRDRKQYSISYLEGELSDFDYTNILDKVFKEYYEKNKDGEILKNIGEIPYDVFEQNYHESFFEDNDEIISGIKSTIVSKTSDEYDKECQDEVDAIIKYIKISEHYDKCSASLKIKYFLEFILENNIEEIEDVNLFVIEYIERYCNNTDDTTIYTNLNTDVSYADNDIKNAVDTFFENKFNEIELTPEQREANSKCNNILDKFFVKNVFENNFIYIKYNYYEFEEMLVNVSVTFKKTNKKYNGFISVDQLVNYITHEDLFD
jgi:hypothetical protein